MKRKAVQKIERTEALHLVHLIILFDFSFVELLLRKTFDASWSLSDLSSEPKGLEGVE
jgi:hypothetical protein